MSEPRTRALPVEDGHLPGTDVAPPQMVSQTRAVLDRYAAAA